MAYTLADYEALQQAIATGAKSVLIQGKRMEYRDLKEMKEILSDIKTELDAVLSPNRKTVRAYKIIAEKDL